MKFILLLACLALYVAATHGQRGRCRGRVSPAGRENCTGGRNEGHRRNRSCRRNANNSMYFYNSRTRSCQRMRYLGCGGNRNRYCSMEQCRRRCSRRDPDRAPTEGTEPPPAHEPPTEPPHE